MATKAKRPLRIVIVGAGIGGLAAACALRQRGFEVAIFERAEKLEEVGAGLQIGPNGVRVLRALGLADELRRNAFEPIDMVSLKWDDASLRFREPMRGYYLEKFGVPYMTAHRAVAALRALRGRRYRKRHRRCAVRRRNASRG